MKTMTRTILVAIVLAGLAAATPAFATGFNANFVISIGGDTYTFTLPDSPTVYTTGGNDFTVQNVEVSLNGGAPQPETVYFAEDQQPPAFGQGGLATFSGTYVFDLVNPSQIGYSALFTGSLTDPSFVAGVYDVQEDDPDTVDGTVTIYTPEPGTLVFFGIGLLFLAGLIRRKLRLPQAGQLVLR